MYYYLLLRITKNVMTFLHFQDNSVIFFQPMVSDTNVIVYCLNIKLNKDNFFLVIVISDSICLVSLIVPEEERNEGQESRQTVIFIYNCCSIYFVLMHACRKVITITLIYSLQRQKKRGLKTVFA